MQTVVSQHTNSRSGYTFLDLNSTYTSYYHSIKRYPNKTNVKDEANMGNTKYPLRTALDIEFK